VAFKGSDDKEGDGGKASDLPLRRHAPNESTAIPQVPNDRAAEEVNSNPTDPVPGMRSPASSVSVLIGYIVGIGEAGPGPRTSEARKRKHDELEVEAPSPKRIRKSASPKAVVDEEVDLPMKREVGCIIPERKPTAENFVNPGKWVALWSEINPTELFDGDVVWEADPRFTTHLRPILEAIGWNATDFKVPKNKAQCFYSSQGGIGNRRCTVVNKGHHGRHMLSHLPEGVGYWIICPSCKAITRRVDNYTRHVADKKGKKRCQAVATDTFEEAYYDKCFLR
jgi:hypothetical protein